MRLLLLFALAFCSPSLAQDLGPEPASLTQKALEEQKKAEAFLRRSERLNMEALEAEQKAARLASAIADHDLEIRRSRKRLRDLSGQYSEAKAHLDQRRQQMGTAFGAMITLAKTPAPAIFAHQGQPETAARSTVALEGVRQALQADMKTTIALIEEIRELRKASSVERETARALIESIRRDEAELRALIESRRKESETSEEQAARAKQEARLLTEQAVKIQVALEREKIIARVPKSAPVRQLPQQSQTLGQPLASESLSAPPSKLITPMPLKGARGKLLHPVTGKIVARFGAIAADGQALQGVNYAAPANSRVFSPWGGTILYAGPFEKYGLVTIIGINDNTLLVLAGMETLERKVNDDILRGEPIGRLGHSQYLVAGTEHYQPPSASLYFEMRRGGKPVDPAPWLESP